VSEPKLGQGYSLLSALVFLLGSVDSGGDVRVLLLGFEDVNLIWEDFLVSALADLETLHDLDLDAENTSTELSVTDGDVDKVVLWLTSGNLVTSSVLLGLGTLTTDLTRDDNLATNGSTSAHDGTNDVVGSETHGGAGEELVLKDLSVGGGAKVLVVVEGLDREVDLVVFVVEVVSLLNEGLDLLDGSCLLVNEVGGLGAADTDFSAHAGKTDLNAGVTLLSESAGEELVEFSLEDSVSNEALLGVHSLDLLVCLFCHLEC